MDHSGDLFARLMSQAHLVINFANNSSSNLVKHGIIEIDIDKETENIKRGEKSVGKR